MLIAFGVLVTQIISAARRRERSKPTLSKNVLFSSDKKNWETPQKFFDALNEEFHFTLDAAASHENHKCENYYTEEQDGLAQDWGGGNSMV